MNNLGISPAASHALPAQQSTDHFVMVRPVRFAGNHQTADSNLFQNLSPEESSPALQARALQEFDGLLKQLLAAGVQVKVVDDTPEPHTPDSLFPNNWFSTHRDGALVLYPMQALNRRLERRRDVIDHLRRSAGPLCEVVDLTSYEERDEFLEGTGSLVLDRIERVAYACLSPRTHRTVLDEWARQLNYRLITFEASDQGAPVYHTNVLMSIGTRFAVVCTQSIAAHHRTAVIQSLQRSGRQIIEITAVQMRAFAGNLLEVQNSQGSCFVVLSQSAFDCLTPAQRTQLAHLGGELIVAAIPTIERLGGGSVRCMLAEVFLPTDL